MLKYVDFTCSLLINAPGVPLPTPSGIMAGTYGMVTLDGEHFEIEIPAFSLDSPAAKRTIN